MAGAAGDESLVVFIGQSEGEAEQERDEASQKVFAAAENDAADGEQQQREHEINRGVGDFADGLVDEIGGFGEFLLVGVRIGDAGFVGGVENFDDELFGKAGTLTVRIFGSHGGEVEDSEEPSNYYTNHDDDEKLFLTHISR